MNRLRELRIKKNKKQKDIASLINKTVQAYSLYERGERNIDNKTLKILSAFYNVSTDYLLDIDPLPKEVNLQVFQNNVLLTTFSNENPSPDDEKKLALMIEIFRKIPKLSIEQVESLNVLVKSIK